MSYLSLLPIIKKTKSNLTPEEFQSIVNVVFHDFEAEQYDKLHANMWQSLQEQINLLVDDLLKNATYSNQKLSFLDVGCGTGLSTQILLNSRLGEHIDNITLLDTSSKMLKLAEEKAKKWNKNYTLLNSDITTLNQQFDCIMICSVLHHIPNLEIFLSQLNSILKPGGILIHLQDPNGDFLDESTYRNRLNDYENYLKKNKKPVKISNFIPKKIKNFLNRKLGRKNYIDLVNDKLIAEKAIKVRMTADEIWSVTDIHVETKLNSLNKGISLNFLKKQLPNFTLINQRSYGFFGALTSDLPDKYKILEEEFIAKNEKNGRNISCIWIKN